jgi:TonB family protein
MVQYILECIAFQLLFLVIYDIFLKQETFFQWNRLYLLGTYILSLVLPWVKIEALKQQISQDFAPYPEFWWNIQKPEIILNATEESFIQFSWQEGILYAGMLVACVLFFFKLRQLYLLKKQGKKIRYAEFTQIIISNSSMAFSFFRSIFLGDKVIAKEHKTIIAHELVHIKQGHTWDLLFFELMRIISWFNPLVYVYQNRTAELHEFIADAQVSKEHKSEHYQQLLSQVFQTEHISFINQFFTKSLIKKRIVMLQKSKSKKVWQLKYLLLVPVVLGMLFYTSCEREIDDTNTINETLKVKNLEQLTLEEENNIMDQVINLSVQPKDWQFVVMDQESKVTFSKAPEGSGISGPGGIMINAKMHIESKVLPDDFDLLHSREIMGVIVDENLVPFTTVEEVPLFPGCEDAADKRACFNDQMQKHIGKNFRYPDEAQKLGIQGRVSVVFVIDEEGQIRNIRERGPHRLLEEEVHRIISKLPTMSPGKDKGKPVKVPFSIPITFKLEQGGFNPVSVDANYVRLQEQQIGELSESSQLEYSNAIPFAIVDKAPIFPGCEDSTDSKVCFRESIQNHISKNFRYPEVAQEKGIQGRVSIVFLINENGEVTSIAKRGPDTSLEDEAVRIINKLPVMKPGIHQGQKVAVPYSIPITFKL